MKDLKEIYCNDDWYVISYTNENIETFNNSSDERTNSKTGSNSLKNEKIKKSVWKYERIPSYYSIKSYI